jgi:hypothetical protein
MYRNRLPNLALHRQNFSNRGLQGLLILSAILLDSEYLYRPYIYFSLNNLYHKLQDITTDYSYVE